jgi:hypothetical protein
MHPSSALDARDEGDDGAVGEHAVEVGRRTVDPQVQALGGREADRRQRGAYRQAWRAGVVQHPPAELQDADADLSHP